MHILPACKLRLQYISSGVEEYTWIIFTTPKRANSYALVLHVLVLTLCDTIYSVGVTSD